MTEQVLDDMERMLDFGKRTTSIGKCISSGNEHFPLLACTAHDIFRNMLPLQQLSFRVKHDEHY